LIPGYSLKIDQSTVNGIFTMETSYVPSTNSSSGDGTRYFKLSNVKEGEAIFRLVYANSSTYTGNYESATSQDFKWSFPIVVGPAPVNVTAPTPVKVNTTNSVKPATNVQANSTNTAPKPANATKPANSTVTKPVNTTAPAVNTTKPANTTTPRPVN
jgi:hypothetical protein